MSVQYKSSDGWKNISSSSNNAVDTVENGNMNPVTSNAVYDKLKGLSTDGNSIRINEAAGPDFMSYLAASSTNASSPEGGEIGLGRAPRSTHITGHIYIDVYDDKVRFFCTYDGQTRIFNIDFATETTYWN